MNIMKGEGKIVFNRKIGFGYAVSMADGDQRDVLEHIMNMEAEAGRLLQDGDKGVVFLGSNFREQDNGFDKPMKVGSKIEINDVEFEVIGFLENKGSAQLDNAVFLNDKDLRDLVNRDDDEYDVIGVRFDENSDVTKIQSDIEKRLRKIRDVDEGEEDFSVQTPASVLESVNSVLIGIQIFAEHGEAGSKKYPKTKRFFVSRYIRFT